MRRADSYPDARSQAILAGRSPAETPSYRLAACIRSFNARLSRLPAETVRELQPEWLSSWATLQADVEETARDDQERKFQLVDNWAETWDARIRRFT